MKTYIVDIDGTLANIEHRLHFIDRNREGGPDWDAFFAACENDKPIQNVIDVIRAIGFSNPMPRIVYLTGRSEAVRYETQTWLFHKHFLPQGEVIMRKANDHRPDTTTKRELMEKLTAEGYEISGIFEDRPSVCRVWREMGLTVFQVGNGEEF